MPTLIDHARRRALQTIALVVSAVPVGCGGESQWDEPAGARATEGRTAEATSALFTDDPIVLRGHATEDGGYASTWANDIDALGRVVGTGELADKSWVPLIWRDISAAPVQLPLPAGFIAGDVDRTSAQAINASGAVVGSAQHDCGFGAGCPYYPLYWAPPVDGLYSRPVVLPYEGHLSFAAGITDDGTIFGTDRTSDIDVGTVWTPTNGSFGVTFLASALDGSSMVTGVSADGAFVSGRGDDTSRAMVWTLSSGIYGSAPLDEGGYVDHSAAGGVNTAGEIVGLGIEPGGAPRALYWAGASSAPVALSFKWSGIGITLTETAANGINDDGQVVGHGQAGENVYALAWSLPLGEDGDACEAAKDCQSPLTCDVTGHCAEPDLPVDASGCACRIGPSAEGRRDERARWGSSLLFGALIAAALRRPRRG